MPFPFRHANGNICCSNAAFPCNDCKARMAAEAEAVSVPDGYAAALQRDENRHSFPARYAALRDQELTDLRSATSALEAAHQTRRPLHPEWTRKIPGEVPAASSERQPEDLEAVS